MNWQELMGLVATTGRQAREDVAGYFKPTTDLFNPNAIDPKVYRNIDMNPYTAQEQAQARQYGAIRKLPITNKEILGRALMGGAGFADFTPIGGTFAGVKALTANKKLMNKAISMLNEGIDRAKVWKDTGWFKDIDGKMKFEIDDSRALLDKSAFEKRNYSTNPNYSFSYEGDLSGALKHPNLYKAYPDSRKINARIGFDEGPSTRFHTLPDGTLPRSAGGSFSPMFNRIETKSGYTEPSSRSTTLHEIQHAIQEKEGFASGGSPTDVGLQQSYWNKYARDYKAGGGPELLDKSDQLSRVLQDLRHVDHINDLRNITQPRQLFNSMPFYEHSRTLRNALGPTPKRGPKYKKWSQDAGKMLADILEGKRQNPNIDKLMTQDRATIKKMVRNAEAKDARLYKKGVMEMRKTRKKMDETDPVNYPWDLEQLHKGYRNLAGEAEARNVQRRMNWSESERKAAPPWLTLDVPEDELLTISRFGEKNKRLPTIEEINSKVVTRKLR